jgi:hypothetical protein
MTSKNNVGCCTNVNNSHCMQPAILFADEGPIYCDMERANYCPLDKVSSVTCSNNFATTTVSAINSIGVADTSNGITSDDLVDVTIGNGAYNYLS